MTDPTADAAKQDDRRAKWTLASGDEMFLVGEDGVGLNVGGHVIVKPIREWHALANTRPQPAAPEGEPDFEKLAREFYMAHGYPDEMWAAGPSSSGEFARQMYRLSLAARPKVEDAEVKDAVKWLREFAKNWADGVAGAVQQDHPAWDMADLLERLAGELIEVKRDRDSWHRFYQGYRKDFEAIYRRLGVPDTNDEQAGINLCDRITALLDSESALAEREAELAKAEDILYAIHCEEGDFVYLKTDTQEFVRRAITKAKDRLRALQQQKASAEQTASKAGETR